MRFQVSSKLVYEAAVSSTIILNIHAFKSEGQFIEKETFSYDPALKAYEWIAHHGQKRFQVIEIPKSQIVTFEYTSIVENHYKVISSDQLDDVQISSMPIDVLPYLNPSRYCQSDKFYKFAFHKFGHINNSFEKVIAIRDWIYKNVEYSAGYTNANTSAYDTVTEQIGVCRDFAHLGIALCRALTIPARYFTGYAYKLKPQDFHACFEVYLGGNWIIVDATKLVAVNGIVKIATGIDATETALASIFGNLNFISMKVNSTLLSDNFEEENLDDPLKGCSFF